MPYIHARKYGSNAYWAFPQKNFQKLVDGRMVTWNGIEWIIYPECSDAHLIIAGNGFQLTKWE